MDFDQFVEYVTIAGVFGVALDQHDLANPHTLAVVRGGYEHTDALGRTPAVDAAAVRGALAGVYHDDVLMHEVTDNNPGVIVAALEAVRSRPEWHVGLDVVPPDGNGDGGVYLNLADMNLYRCLQAHRAQADWRPDLPGLDALWIRFYEPEAGPQPWVQPYGGSGTYVSGAEVTHNGFLWRNIIPPPTLNVWEPGVYGWQQLGPVP